jgi:hypothetical protein
LVVFTGGLGLDLNGGFGFVRLCLVFYKLCGGFRRRMCSRITMERARAVAAAVCINANGSGSIEKEEEEEEAWEGIDGCKVLREFDKSFWQSQMPPCYRYSNRSKQTNAFRRYPFMKKRRFRVIQFNWFQWICPLL